MLQDDDDFEDVMSILGIFPGVALVLFFTNRYYYMYIRDKYKGRGKNGSSKRK